MRKEKGVTTIAVEETKRPKKMCCNTFGNSRGNWYYNKCKSLNLIPKEVNFSILNAL